jgi:hypothetical protein
MLEALARIGGGDPAPRDRGIRARGVVESSIYSSLTIAITIPASTKSTIAACVQIQNGDTLSP